MATKASNFTDADALTGDELIPVIQNGNKKTTLNEIANFIGTDVSVAQEAATRADADSNLQTQINTLDSTKLNAADYNEHFKGKYPTLSALQTAYPTANSGDYAQVDTGAGSDVINYNWDVEDGWIEGGSGSAATNTDQLPEGSTNLYFTAVRVLATVLTGFSAIAGGDIVSTDTVLQAFGKIQKRFNDLLTNFNGANQLVQLDANAKLPAVDGSRLTNLPGTGATIDDAAPSLTKVYSSQKTEDITATKLDKSQAGSSSYLYEPTFNNVLSIERVSSNSLRFKAGSTFLVSHFGTIELSAASDYEAAMSDTGNILVLDSTRPWTLNGSYKKYSVGGTDNALVQKKAADLIDSDIPLSGFYNYDFIGYPVGEFIRTFKMFEGLQFSPYGQGLVNISFPNNASVLISGDIYLYGKGNGKDIRLIGSSSKTFAFSPTLSQILVFDKRRPFSANTPTIDYDQYSLDTALTGTISTTGIAGDFKVTGVGTKFTTELKVGDVINEIESNPNFTTSVYKIISDTELYTLGSDTAGTGATLPLVTNHSYTRLSSVYIINQELFDSSKHIPLLLSYRGKIVSGFGLMGGYYSSIRPTPIYAMFEPFFGTTQAVVKVNSSSIKFLGTFSTFVISNNITYELYTPADYTVSFTNGNILAVDTTKTWAVDGAYRKYTVGDANNCLVLISATILTNSGDKYVPICGFYGNTITGFGLGDFLSNSSSPSSPSDHYRICADKVISNALVYSKDSANNDNYMFIVVNDIHTSNGSTGRLESFNEALSFAIDAISELPVKFGISNGDLCDGLRSTKASYQLDVNSYIGAYNTAPLLWLNAIGNHDDNSYINIYSEVYTKADQRTNFINPIANKFPSKIVTGTASNACYYYMDDATFKIRNIVLDPLDIPYVANGSALKYKGLSQYGFSNTQLNWLAGTALNLSALATPTQWTINIFCHVPIRNASADGAPGDFMHPTDIVPKIVNAFKNGTSVNETYTDTTYGGDFSYSVSQNFATLNGGGANFTGYFSGHRHIDLLLADPLFPDQKNIVVNNAWTLRDQTWGSTVNRSLNTTTQNSFDLIIIDKVARKVRSLRFGAGIKQSDEPVFLFQRTFNY